VAFCYRQFLLLVSSNHVNEIARARKCIIEIEALLDEKRLKSRPIQSVSPRRMLLKMWRQRRPTGCDLPWPPIEMLAGKSDFSRGNSSAAISQHNTWMLGFAFDSRYMDRLSDESVKSVIAHELAHAVLVIQDVEGLLSEAA
jgi:hypothetical protein